MVIMYHTITLYFMSALKVMCNTKINTNHGLHTRTSLRPACNHVNSTAWGWTYATYNLLPMQEIGVKEGDGLIIHCERILYMIDQISLSNRHCSRIVAAPEQALNNPSW